MSAPNGLPVAAFVLSLIAALLILGVAGMTISGGWFAPYRYHGGMMGGYYPMMGGSYGMPGTGSGWYFVTAALVIVTGIAVLLGAAMLYTKPAKASTWGIVILVSSVVSLLGMGGFFLGAILGFVGGILALNWKPVAA